MFLVLGQVTCSKLQQSDLPDAKLLAAISNAVGVYYNSTGKTKCFNTQQQAVSSLGDKGWNFQVRTKDSLEDSFKYIDMRDMILQTWDPCTCWSVLVHVSPLKGFIIYTTLLLTSEISPVAYIKCCMQAFSLSILMCLYRLVQRWLCLFVQMEYKICSNPIR